MISELDKTINATVDKAQYDECAKRIISEKIVLAHILIYTVEEFKDMSPEDVIPFIEGEVFVGEVPIDSGLTNQQVNQGGTKIVGLNVENSEIKEGLIRFDVIFYVRMRDGLSQIIINIEIQKSTPTSYHILNRAIFYMCRMISSQKERDFVKSNYDDIKRVYSIWICMNMERDSMCLYQLKKNDIVGKQDWRGRQDLLNIVMIGVQNQISRRNKKYALHRLLRTLLSDKISIQEKTQIISQEYQIKMDDKMREVVNTMCNLSDGIEERGIERGIEKTNIKVIINMCNKGYSLETISDIVEIPVAEVKKILENPNQN